MKRSRFLDSAMITTIGIIICKIIGIVYVIPFYSMIGTSGGALYSYGYSIYALFLCLSTSGIPIAIAKLISEYQALGYDEIKERTYKIGLSFIFIISIVLFIIMLLMAPFLAHLIIGGVNGGNTVSNVTMVIRVISISLWIIPLVAVTKGYFQGLKKLKVISIADIIEQIVRVIVILGGAFFSLKIFHLSINTAVGIAVFGTTVGGIAAYLYLILKRKNKKVLPSSFERRITNKMILKKIIIYAIPFIVIDLVKSGFALVDTFTIIKPLIKLNFSGIEAEFIQSVITTWGSKLNMIVVSISLGISISVIPHLVSAHTRNNKEEKIRYIHEAILVLALVVIPLTLILSFLSTSIWTLFYGANSIGSNIFKLSVYSAITFSFLTVLINIAESLNHTKVVMKTLLVVFIGKIITNVPSMYIASYFGINAYYGPIFTTIIFEIIGFAYLFGKVIKLEQIKIEKTVYYFIKIILCSLIMLMCLKIIGLFIPCQELTKGSAFIKIFGYGLVAFLIYLSLIVKVGIFKEIFKKKK